MKIKEGTLATLIARARLKSCRGFEINAATARSVIFSCTTAQRWLNGLIRRLPLAGARESMQSIQSHYS